MMDGTKLSVTGTSYTAKYWWIGLDVFCVIGLIEQPAFIFHPVCIADSRTVVARLVGVDHFLYVKRLVENK